MPGDDFSGILLSRAFVVGIDFLHRFDWNNHNLVTAFRTNVGFAAGAGKTVAARPVQLLFIPAFSAMGAGNLIIFLSLCHYFT